jgi:hypothetical protein
MSEEQMDYSFIIDLIDGGELDSMMDLLGDSVRARRDYLRELRGAINKATFMPGTKVRLINIWPKYLHGITGVVSSQTPSRRGDLMVDVDPSCYHRLGYRYDKVLGVPASSLEEVQ